MGACRKVLCTDKPMLDKIEGVNGSNPPACGTESVSLTARLSGAASDDGCPQVCSESPGHASLVSAGRGCAWALPNSLGKGFAADIGEGVGGNGVWSGVVQGWAQARTEVDGGAEKWSGDPACGEAEVDWIASMDNCSTEPPRLCSKLLLPALSDFAVSCNSGALSDSKQRLSAKLMKLRCTGFLAGTMT